VPALAAERPISDTQPNPAVKRPSPQDNHKDDPKPANGSQG